MLCCYTVTGAASAVPRWGQRRLGGLTSGGYESLMHGVAHPHVRLSRLRTMRTTGRGLLPRLPAERSPDGGWLGAGADVEPFSLHAPVGQEQPLKFYASSPTRARVRGICSHLTEALHIPQMRLDPVDIRLDVIDDVVVEPIAAGIKTNINPV
jgi:hypothetical protein